MLGGCDMMGKGSQDALYKLPEKGRVLVLVDARPTSGMPLDAPSSLGKQITDLLYQHKVADNFVDQGRLTELRKDARFADMKQMGIADVAVLTDADTVVYVDVLQFQVDTLSDGQVTEGNAVAQVKVVSRAGKRLWPAETEVLGYQIQTTVNPNLVEQAPPNVVKGKLVKDLSVLVGRLFFKYDLEDKELNPKP